ncbi:MAG: aconitate hydratase, partial [Thermoleophilia bacterium]|nr:aconitate hydratase [Thermoleophilia bacterium]
ARKAVELGLRVKPWVRTSLAPGSRAVTGYLQEAGLLGALEALGFSVVGYGCATCIGNSGPLDEELERVVRAEQLVVAAVLSGNRNFEGRIHAAVRASYLASPPLVVAYALAGTVDIDLTSEPVGTRADGRPVYLSDLWPDQEEVARLMVAAVRPQTFREEYEKALEGTEAWRQIEVPQGALFAWDPDSTYVREPPFFHDLRTAPAAPGDIRAAAVLAVLGDSVTTDHISPAGSIPRTSPAGRYLLEHNVRPADFNTYGSRRGNHEVLVRGTFANERLRNRMVVDREGGWTTAYPSGEVLPIYDAAMRCLAVAAPLVVLAGKEYGTGSSRDWAAKGPALLGVRAVIAESFERIHRSNLVGMGVLPLELEPGVTWSRVGVNGSEIVSIEGVGAINGPGATVTVRLRRPLRALRAQAGLLGEGALIGGRQIGRAETGGADPDEVVLTCRVRLDSMVEVEYFRHGGVLPYVLRAKSGGSA